MAGDTYPLKPAPNSPEFLMKPVEVLKSEESWTKLFLEDGTVLRVKIVVSKVGKSVDKPIPDSGGEPLYHIQSGTLVIADVSDSAKFKAT